MTFEEARAFAASLPEVREVPSYGTPGFKVKGQLFARWRPDLEALVLRTEFTEREKLLKTRAKEFFLTEHYENYPWILLRLSATTPAKARAAITRAHEIAGAAKGHSSRGDAEFLKQMRRRA